MTEPTESSPRFDIQVRLVYRERWRRVLVLTGDIESTLIYDPRGSGERVYLDGQLWAHSSIWSWQIVYPYIEFPLPTANGDLRARIEVAGSFLPWQFGTTRFCFLVEGVLLYDEHCNEYWFRNDCGRVTDEPYEPDY